MITVLLVSLLQIAFANSGNINNVIEVMCPSFEDVGVNRGLFSLSGVSGTNNEYCECGLTERGTSKTAIIKCEFSDDQDIVLKDTLFPFKKKGITSAYVRMQNARSATITSEFLSSWMDSPSSALDIWHCSKVIIESTPQPNKDQLFSQLKSFVGVGIINCTLDALPTKFLRDRSRGALRLKGCFVGRISAGIFHNVEEIRYMNFEDTIVEEVEGPLSSSGVITLSKKEIHSWDGIKFHNATFKHVAPYSFNVTHKDIMEKFVVEESNFGKLDKGGISATGDINVAVTNSSFSKLDSMAIQVSVTGLVSFSNNVIEDYESDSLLGLKCMNTTTVNNNIFYVAHQKQKNKTSEFMDKCGKPKVSYIVIPNQKYEALHSITTPVVSSVVIIVLLLAGGLLLWAWKNMSLFRYHYRRSDIPLCREDKPDGVEDPMPPSSGCSSSTIHNASFRDQKVY